MRWMWPHRSLIDAGIPAPGHSDFAVCRVNPWTAMWSMVARRSESGRSLDAREAITVAEALGKTVGDEIQIQYEPFRITGISVPFAVLGVWWVVRRIRRSHEREG